jgi:hypothetical protein
MDDGIFSLFTPDSKFYVPSKTATTRAVKFRYYW